PDDDDDFDTLIRIPGRPSPGASSPSNVLAAPVPAAGRLPEDDARTRAPVPPPVVPPEARVLEELTPTHTNVPVQKRQSTGLGGTRKKKSTHGVSGKSASGTGAG